MQSLLIKLSLKFLINSEWTNVVVNHSGTVFDEFAPESTFPCDLSYSLKLRAADGSNEITGVDSSVLIFSIVSDQCDVQMDGELRKGEWVSC